VDSINASVQLSPQKRSELVQMLVPTESSSARLSAEVFMMTTPANDIREEVWELINHQIEAFGRPSRLTPFELSECHCRTERIKHLGQELERM
jgi:hypothetical protein